MANKLLFSTQTNDIKHSHADPNQIEDFFKSPRYMNYPLGLVGDFINWLLAKPCLSTS